MSGTPRSGTPESGTPAQVIVRVSVTDASGTRRSDLVLEGRRGTLVTAGSRTGFDVGDLWHTVRHLVPDHAHLRADPVGAPTPDPAPPGPELTRDCRAVVAIAVAGRAGDHELAPVLRTWLATDAEVYGVEPVAEDEARVLSVAPGTVADLLLWDVTGALQALVGAERAS